jgi:hypothetical protein
MNDDPRVERALYVIAAIEKRLEVARLREDYDDTRVDLLAIIQFIQRNLGRIDTDEPPPSE